MMTLGLIIDPQIDFCDPAVGTLYVPGAEKDMARLAALIRRMGMEIGSLSVTLDSHQYVDIAHPVWWIDAGGAHPAPFTIISTKDIESGRWKAARPEAQERSASYVAALEKDGRYPLCIWPYHCLIGTPGQAVMPELFAAFTEWETTTGRPVDFVTKGQNIWTEHYSAIRAEVPDPDDPGTHPNTALIERVRRADRVFIAGEAGSHCVANTVRDLADSLGDDSQLAKMTLLTDAVSPVAGFEPLQAAFLSEMVTRGLKTATTGSYGER